MTVLKIASKAAAAADEALEPHVRRVYDRPGLRLMVIGELEHVERTQPAPGSDTKPSVKIRIAHLEVAHDDQEPAVRDALRFLHLQRTARGTLDDDGQLQLTERTLELTGGHLAYVEAARLRAALDHWAAYARKTTHADLTLSEMQQELSTVADGLTAALSGASSHEGESG